MTPHRDMALPHKDEMCDCVFAKTSLRTGHLEDQTLNLDTRSMAIMGKRQRLSVSSTLYFQLRYRIITLILAASGTSE